MPKAPTRIQRLRWQRIRPLGCILRLFLFGHECSGYTQIHHCGTNAGGRKDHDKVLPLCVYHHGLIQKWSLRVWQKFYKTEEYLMTQLKHLEEENDNA